MEIEANDLRSNYSRNTVASTESLDQHVKARMDETERKKILYRWNDTGADFPRDKSVHQIFEEQAAINADAIALIFEGASLTYAQLNRQANQLAHYLRSLGVEPDARVAICLERSLEMVVALLAVLKAGCAYVPLDPAYPVNRLHYMIEDSAPIALLTQTSLLKIVTGGDHSMPVLDVTAPAPIWQNQPCSNPGSEGLSSDHLVYVIYTSGSTGKPKGVMVEHRSLVNRLLWMQSAYGLRTGDIVLQKTPFSFDVSVWEFFWPLLNGIPLVMAKPGGHKDPAYLVEIINRQRITTMHFVPSMLQVFVEQADAALCSTLSRVFSSGEALPLALARKVQDLLPHAALYNLYGPTETTVDVTAWTCTSDAVVATIPIGRPISNMRAYILDPDGEPVPIGVTGELFIGGVGVARGYLNRPALTAERFLVDPFSSEPKAKMYRSGDLCRWKPNGDIEYLGRDDFQVKIRGFRIELGEIEARLTEHADISTAVVIVREDSSGEKRLVAYIIVKAGVEMYDHDLRALLRRNLPEYMVPSSFVPLDVMPVTVNGKLDRAALPKLSAINQLLRQTPLPKLQPTVTRDKGAYVPPSDTLEIQLIQIWERILNVAPIGVGDDFFQLGGHSLQVARMLAQVAEKLKRRLPFATMFRAPTIEKLAEVIRTEGWTSHWSVLVPIKEQGSKPPLFMVHGLGGNVINYYGMRECLPADQPLYGIQAVGLDTGRTSLASIPEMARFYIQEVRSLQPRGPYLLGGYSAGGLVAYEMARQLDEAGERVEFLALIDSYVEAAGGYWLKSLYSSVALRMSLLDLADSFRKIRKFGLRRVLRHKVHHIGMNMRIARWRLSEKISGKGQAALHGQKYFLSPAEAFIHSIRVYAPQSYSGSVTSFRSTASDFVYGNVSNGWARYVSGKLETRKIRGHHDELFQEPNISSLAKQLMQALGES